MPKTKRFTFTLPDELREKLTKIAKQRGHPAALVLCDLIRDYRPRKR